MRSDRFGLGSLARLRAAVADLCPVVSTPPFTSAGIACSRLYARGDIWWGEGSGPPGVAWIISNGEVCTDAGSCHFESLFFPGSLFPRSFFPSLFFHLSPRGFYAD